MKPHTQTNQPPVSVVAGGVDPRKSASPLPLPVSVHLNALLAKVKPQ